MREITPPLILKTLRKIEAKGNHETAYGFRATFSTLANESVLWNPDAIERALAHVEANDVRRAYARGNIGTSG